jgi:hypothetical protein
MVTPDIAPDRQRFDAMSLFVASYRLDSSDL